MGKKKKKRKKNKSQRPPLSLLDKAVYCFLFLLILILGFALAYIAEGITDGIAFRDTEVVAYSYHMTFLFMLPVVLYIPLSGFIYFIDALESKKPIFGNRNIQYGKAPWDTDVFPLFDTRRKKVYVRPSHKEFRKIMLLVWTVGLLVCIAISPFGLFSRDCLKEDNSIVSYNIINVQKDIQYNSSDYEHLTIRTSYSSGYRSVYHYYRYEITIDMKDGESFSFSSSEFVNNKEDYHKNCIYRMLEIKSLFPSEQITIKGEEDLQKVIDDTGMNEEQIKLLNQLFS